MSRGRVQVVVPCYNEATRFDPAALSRALSADDELCFVLVDDGSTDDTAAVLHATAKRHPGRVDVLELSSNVGKAEAVRQGLLLAFARGAELAGYWDADLATPLDAIADFVAVLDSRPEVEIALGARVAMLGHAIERRATRHYAGRVFATFASVTLGLPVYDTQCGAKLFRCSDAVRELFTETFGSRWVFDVEIIARYLANGGQAEGIRELALSRWTDVEGSKVRPRDFASALAELIRIRRKYGSRGR